MANILGEGSYGQVLIKQNKAVKKFHKLSAIVQETIALKYLDQCRYVVHSTGFNLKTLELQMELYDTSLRGWLNKKNKTIISKDDINKIIHDILCGLIELHDRGLTHGDLKPSNILIMENPLRAVLGDCGFVSVYKYAKIRRTAEVYRDPEISFDNTHDLFSLGICLLELYGDIKLNRPAKYEELRHLIKQKISNSEHQKTILSLVQYDKNKRPTARQLLYQLYGENYPLWAGPTINKTEPSEQMLSSENRIYIRNSMKKLATKYHLKRAKKGYTALIYYLNSNYVSTKLHKLYIGTTAFILGIIFSDTAYKEQNVIEFCDFRFDSIAIQNVITELINDNNFISILLSP